MTIEEQVKEYQRRYGVTMLDIATAAGINKANLRRIMTSDPKRKAPALERLLAVLAEPPTWQTVARKSAQGAHWQRTELGRQVAAAAAAENSTVEAWLKKHAIDRAAARRVLCLGEGMGEGHVSKTTQRMSEILGVETDRPIVNVWYEDFKRLVEHPTKWCKEHGHNYQELQLLAKGGRAGRADRQLWKLADEVDAVVGEAVTVRLGEDD